MDGATVSSGYVKSICMPFWCNGDDACVGAAISLYYFFLVQVGLIKGLGPRPFTNLFDSFIKLNQNKMKFRSL
jgi:hypothetical protein